MARKPISEKTIAKNCLKWGVGAINVDGCRVGNGSYVPNKEKQKVKGRYPANLIHDGSESVAKIFSKFSKKAKRKKKKPYVYNDREYNNKKTSMFNGDKPQAPSNYNDAGSPMRYFYCAKAGKKERNEGLNNGQTEYNKNEKDSGFHDITLRNNNHPTVKPLKLMKYLVKLITPKTGIVLDPFAGSGTTGCAAIALNRKFIGIDNNERYIKIAQARIEHILQKQMTLLNQLKQRGNTDE